MGVKRPNGIGGIQIVGIGARHDVHSTTQCIAGQTHGQHALIYLDAVGHVGRDGGQVERRAKVIHGNAVEEKLHLVAREAIHREAVVGTQSTVLANIH